MNKRIKTILFSVALLTTSSALNASDTTSSMLVSTTVAASCAINRGALGFAGYDPTGSNASAPLNTNSAIEIRCTKNTTASISLDSGMHAGNASGTHRAMANSDGSEYLSYDLYTNSSYSSPWTEQNQVTYTANDGRPTLINVYGSIPANQNISDGTYNDVITINATF